MISKDYEGGWPIVFHMGIWFSIRAEEWSGQRVHQSDSLILSKVGVRKHRFNALWKGCRLLGWQESGCTIERYWNTSPEESSSRMTTAIHLRQLLWPFSFCSLRRKKVTKLSPGRKIHGLHMLDGCVLSEQRNKQPFPMNTICPDGTISYTYISLIFNVNYINLRAIFFKKNLPFY